MSWPLRLGAAAEILFLVDDQAYDYQMLKHIAFGMAVVVGGGVTASVSAADAGIVTVSKRDCQRIVAHQPRGDVEYKSGVDVRGKKVKGADLPGGNPIKMPDEITIDVGINLADKYGLGAGGQYKAEGSVGKITVKGNKTYWNGQPLDQADQNAIARACQEKFGKR